MLLVFGAIPKPDRATQSPSQISRAQAIDKAMVEVDKVWARRRIAFGIKHTEKTHLESPASPTTGEEQQEK